MTTQNQLGKDAKFSTTPKDDAAESSAIKQELADEEIASVSGGCKSGYCAEIASVAGGIVRSLEAGTTP